MTDAMPQSSAAAPMGALVGGVLGVTAGLALHILLDDRDRTLEEWLLAFPYQFSAEYWAAGGAVLGALLAHLLGWLRLARRRPKQR